MVHILFWNVSQFAISGSVAYLYTEKAIILEKLCFSAVKAVIYALNIKNNRYIRQK